MLKKIHTHRPLQLFLGLIVGFCFGFLLNKGQVTYYQVILRQLLLQDFTVLKVMLSAIATGMIGIYAMRSRGWVNLHKKSGSLGTNVPGPLIFGIGFGLLGYCPGTAVGAAGHGALDALVSGVIGMLLGAGLYAAVYPRVKNRVLEIGSFGDRSLVDFFEKKHQWKIIAAAFIVILLFLLIMEWMGF